MSRRSRERRTDLERAFGAYLRAQREEKGTDQATFARRIGWNQPRLSRMERGEMVPTIEDLERAARFFEVTPWTLLEAMARHAELAAEHRRNLRLGDD